MFFLLVRVCDVLLQKVGSGISRAAASANNPLHWFSGGHTHQYPKCDNDESAPVTPSAAMTASSDAGPVSFVSSIDDSALRGTPRSPGHVTYSKLCMLRALNLATASVASPASVWLHDAGAWCLVLLLKMLAAWPVTAVL